MHTLPDSAFIQRLQHYQGTPLSVLNNEELMNLMLPTLRADFTLLETYRYQPDAPFDFAMTGMWGQQDNIVSQADVAAWQVYAGQFFASGDRRRPLFSCSIPCLFNSCCRRLNPIELYG